MLYFLHHVSTRVLRPPSKQRERQKYRFFSSTVKRQEDQANISSAFLGRILSPKAAVLANGWLRQPTARHLSWNLLEQPVHRSQSIGLRGFVMRSLLIPT